LGSQQQFPFGAWRLSVAEGLAKAGGLNDAQADPAAVFLYRGETREVAEALGIDCSRFEGAIIPVIYNFNFRGAAGYFLATTFEMRNKDVMFASNSVSVESTKFMTYVRTINGTINDPISTAITAVTLRNLLELQACHRYYEDESSLYPQTFQVAEQLAYWKDLRRPALPLAARAVSRPD
jgi:polysaccharide export outer membrane protein